MSHFRKLRPIFCFFVIIFFPLIGFAKEVKEPISVYLTWTHSPESTIVIQWITDSHHSSDEIHYRKLNERDWKTNSGSHFHLSEFYPLFLHRIELTNLDPGTTYEFKNDFDLIYKFKTMPSNLASPIKFIAGGDMYHEKTLTELVQTNLEAAKYDPMFVLVGGDIAYAHDRFDFFSEKSAWVSWIMETMLSKQKKRNRWLAWLITWKKTMVTSDGCLIPMITTIGNHDVNGRYGQTPQEAKSFYELFAFPGKQGCNVLDFGKYMSIFTLDSGHTHPIPGDQTNWLYSALAERQQVPKKMAFYHVPAFPSVRNFDEKHSALIRKYWVPIFDQFNLQVAFENHDHTYKRTHPIKDGSVNLLGTVYLGDGAWGIKYPRKPKKIDSTWYLAKAISTRNFILVEISEKNIHFRAISDEGELIDSGSIN